MLKFSRPKLHTRWKREKRERASDEPNKHDQIQINKAETEID